VLSIFCSAIIFAVNLKLLNKHSYLHTR
jgi:hypothetical protein